jgi:hypothetical protein
MLGHTLGLLAVAGADSCWNTFCQNVAFGFLNFCPNIAFCFLSFWNTSVEILTLKMNYI